MQRLAPLSMLVTLGAVAEEAGAPDGGVVTGCALDVEVTGLKPGGVVWILLFVDPAAFPTKRDRAVRHAEAVPENGRARATFAGLPPGEYAVGVVHDENGNGKLDRWFFGPPKEGTAASRGARGLFGPPKFKEASFRLAEGHTSIAVAIVY